VLFSQRNFSIKIASFGKFKKNKKNIILYRKIRLLDIFFFHFFFRPSSWLVREVRFGPPNFDRRLGFHGDMTETKSAILRNFIKNINFFTDQDMIKAIAQNCTKMMVQGLHKVVHHVQSSKDSTG